jgi:tetratricopeptide (TPR) repeat protein
MFTLSENLIETLIGRRCRVAVAARCLAEGRYSKAVEICREQLAEQPASLSSRIIYARALFHAGQTESAADQFYRVLSVDPENLVALKYLGDIKYAAGDEPGAMADYGRVLTIDPCCRALFCQVRTAKTETTRTITIQRPEETLAGPVTNLKAREIPFYTETIADLYLAQGYPRLAADVYRSLSTADQNPRIMEKLTMAEEKTKQKESSHVKKTD